MAVTGSLHAQLSTKMASSAPDVATIDEEAREPARVEERGAEERRAAFQKMKSDGGVIYHSLDSDRIDNDSTEGERCCVLLEKERERERERGGGGGAKRWCKELQSLSLGFYSFRVF